MMQSPSGQMYLFPMEEAPKPDIHPRDTKKWNEFMQFHTNHPEAYEYFVTAVHEAKSNGFTSIGAKLIVERIRWSCLLDTKQQKYKINNNHFPYYARLFIVNNPEFENFFELRKLKE